MNAGVAIVGLSEDPMKPEILEQRADDSAKRLARQPAALALGRERHANFSRSRLTGCDPDGAITP